MCSGYKTTLFELFYSSRAFTTVTKTCFSRKYKIIMNEVTPLINEACICFARKARI